MIHIASKCHRRRGSTAVAILFTVLQKGYPSAESHADTQARLTSHAAQVSSCRAGSFTPVLGELKGSRVLGGFSMLYRHTL